MLIYSVPANSTLPGDACECLGTEPHSSDVQNPQNLPSHSPPQSPGGTRKFWEFHPLKHSLEQRIGFYREMLGVVRICAPPLLLIHLPHLTGHFR